MTLALLAASVGGCIPYVDPLIQRASAELGCEPTMINMIERGDIGYAVFDVEACGHRARYTCVGGRHEPYHCIHEPDPRIWDPDPAVAATLPDSPGASGAPTPFRGQWRRICGPEEDQCAFKQNGIWRWRPARPTECSYGPVCY